MSFSVSRWFQEAIVERAKRILWTRFAAEMETEALLDYADQLSRIEDQAAEFEADGKHQLAQLLRNRATEINPENPIAAADRAAKLLADEHQPLPALPAPTTPEKAKAKSADKPVGRAKRRGRPKKADVKSSPPESGALPIGHEAKGTTDSDDGRGE